jgi:hypothetical protein
MSLIDEIEHLGALRDAGQLTTAESTHRLQQFSDGGLTRIGAESAIQNWRTCRRDYTAVFNRTTALLRQLDGEAS